MGFLALVGRVVEGTSVWNGRCKVGDDTSITFTNGNSFLRFSGACGVNNPEFVFWKRVESVGALHTFLPFENITIGFIDLFSNCSGEGIKESASGTSIIFSFSVSEGSLITLEDSSAHLINVYEEFFIGGVSNTSSFGLKTSVVNSLEAELMFWNFHLFSSQSPVTERIPICIESSTSESKRTLVDKLADS